MRDFRRVDGGYAAHLDAGERRVLLDVVDGVIDLLDDGTGSPGAAGPRREGDPSPEQGPGDLFASLAVPDRVEVPQDPALLRLLPDASDDPEIAGELRRFTEADVRRGKLDRLRAWRAAIQRAEPSLVVPAATAADHAAAITDVRLVLASRLGVETDEQADAVYALAAAPGPPGDDEEATRRFLASVYAVLTALQESLVALMVGDLDTRTPGG